MNVVQSKCPRCKNYWRHKPISNDIGYYHVTCDNCNTDCWRCSSPSCSRIVLSRRQSEMIQHQSKYHTPTSETDVDIGGDGGGTNDMLFSDSGDTDSGDGDNQQQHSTSSTTNNADINTNTVKDDCTYENNIEISKTYPEYEQLMADAYAANIDIINKRGTSILSLFQPQDYIHVEDEDIIDNNEKDTSESNETTANLLSYLEVEDNGEVELDSTCTTTHTTTDNNKMALHDFNYMIGDDNRLYNMQEHNEGVGKYGGIRSLTQRALSRSKTTNKLSTFKEARLMFGILNCLVNQTAKQQEEFLVHNSNLIDFLLDGKGAPPIEIPCDRKSANDICLQNRHSMFINAPCCNVIDIDGFACIEIDDVLDHMFASGVEFDFPQDHLGNTSSSGFNGTDAVQSLLREQQRAVSDASPEMRYRTCYGHIMSWSDSFLLRFLRQRDNSIWLFVVRICPPPGKSTSKTYMKVLAFGQSKKNKDNVLAHYFKSFQDLMPGKMRYYGHKDVRGMVYTSFGSVLHLGDTPDRNATTKSMHLGIYGKRSGWAGKIDLDKLPYCSSCFARACNLALLYEDAIPDESMNFACTRCCGWDYESTGRAIEFDTTEGTAYPTTCSPSNPHPAPKYRTANERYIRPVKQSFEWMIQGVKFAYYEHLHGDWNMTTTRYYLATMAINHEVQEMVIKAVEKAKQHGPAAVTEVDYIPKLWLLDYDFEKFIETIMHLIGHGIVASVMGLMQNILKEHSLGTTFENFCNPYLKDIEACRLQWIRVKTLPKSSWLAEDEFGFARVMLFLYGQFFNKQDLGRVTANSTLLSQTLLQIKQLLNSCVVMISLIMSKENICTNVLDIHIKIFLQCCHRLCRAYYDDSVEEFSSCQFLGTTSSSSSSLSITSRLLTGILICQFLGTSSGGSGLMFNCHTSCGLIRWSRSH